KIIKEDKKIKTKEKDIYIDSFNHQTGYESMMAAYKKGEMPTVFICGSDTIAMGALSALGELDTKLSEKISIISYNNIKSAQYMNPPLTSLSLNTKYMGELAGNLVKHMSSSSHVTPIKVMCATHLVIRESVYDN
ncbi:MAG: substrate-binding domain-containing protein, partial [Atopostipes suicloacalis]|nr:substrate-binding domain-containing protein [Atopostipes suicloacalis]